jgi:6-phosphogluconolactonase
MPQKLRFTPMEGFSTSNRGDDSIVVLAIDGGTGRLTFMQRVPTHGKAPRNFVVSPTGEHLFAANQDSGNIVEFPIDQTTGRLNAGIQVTNVPSPVCLVFAPVD